ncbi:hypothetical protein C9I36_10630 [Pectobacterium punjabense]|nr:hypothetical protein C9I36_10630 [Pectobacterium punjabense]
MKILFHWPIIHAVSGCDQISASIVKIDDINTENKMVYRIVNKWFYHFVLFSKNDDIPLLTAPFIHA